MPDKMKVSLSRRRFLKTGLGAAPTAGFPAIVPASVFGQYEPSKRINVGAIGVGRISRGHDMPSILQYDNARIKNDDQANSMLSRPQRSPYVLA